jgi:plastocyanin
VHVRVFLVCLIVAGLVHPALAGEVRGAIIVKRKLTRRAVAPAANTYERGPAVAVAADSEDALAYERAHTVVFLEGELPPAPPVTREMRQKDRAFGPDLIVVPAGSFVSFPNLDPIFHNVFSLSKPKSFDLGNYSKGQTRTVEFAKTGLVLVNCRLHTNMSAVIVVTPNGYYAAPDSNGNFAIPDVPEGDYTVVAWHKAAGFLRKKIAVSNASPVKIDFLIPLDNAPKLNARR